MSDKRERERERQKERKFKISGRSIFDKMFKLIR